MTENEKKFTGQSVSRRITQRLLILMVIMAAVITALSYRALEDTYTRLYNEKAQDLASRFIKNFVKYTTNEAGKALVEAGPQL